MHLLTLLSVWVTIIVMLYAMTGRVQHGPLRQQYLLLAMSANPGADLCNPDDNISGRWQTLNLGALSANVSFSRAQLCYVPLNNSKHLASCDMRGLLICHLSFAEKC